MNNSIKDRFYELLSMQVGGQNIDLNNHLINEGYFSSMEYMTFLIQIESEFNIRFSNDDLAFGCLFTPSAIIKKIDQLIADE